mgnify:CR=1 FL=1
MKKRIVCFGDSNTWGYNALESSRYGEEIRWTGRLQRLLGEEYTVIEEAQNGRTTVWDDPIENRLAGLTYLWPCMESHSPFDLLIIMLGTNDTKLYFNVPARSIADGAGRLVRLAQQSDYGIGKKAPKVLLISPVRIEESEIAGHIFGRQAAEKSRGFSQAYQEVAGEYGCYFLDAARYAAPCEYDGVHLDEDGHKKLACAVYDKVKNILG